MTDVSLVEAFETRLRRLAAERTVDRIWARDVTVWSADPDTPELGDRLGWLDLPETMEAAAGAAVALAEDVAGWCDRVVLCGMGGSSLAPEVLWRTFGPRAGFPHLVLLDSTHPAAVRDAAEAGAPERTLVLVASKSGTTLETASFEEFFWDRFGGDGTRFVAITDPDTALARRARERGYRHTVLSPPEVGGRFSALSPFGLVPAALLGIDVHALLAHARAASDACRRVAPENPAARLGALMGEAALRRRDKLTVLLDDGLESFGLWVEQLVAESTGKSGRGILPVVGEVPDDLSGSESDRVFAVRGFGNGGSGAVRGAADRLARVAGPVDAAWLGAPEELGGEFFRWELATAIAGAILNVNPFDQPNVAESKTNTARMLKEPPGDSAADDPEALPHWLAGVGEGDYVAVTAYVPPSRETDGRLALLRRAMAQRTGGVVTVGYGPRFLHSTGQLHKGGPPRGHFLQIVDRPVVDVPVPGAPYGFARLIAAQADGDREALQARGRPVLRLRDLDRALGEVAP